MMKPSFDYDDTMTIRVSQFTKLQRRYDVVAFKLRNERLTRALKYIETYLETDEPDLYGLSEAKTLISSVLEEEEHATKG